MIDRFPLCGAGTKSAPTQIRAVSFDASMTLLRPPGSVGQVYAEVAAECGCLGLPPEALTRRFHVAWQARNHFNHTRDEWVWFSIGEMLCR